jgi:hypothetical protein
MNRGLVSAALALAPWLTGCGAQICDEVDQLCIEGEAQESDAAATPDPPPANTEAALIDRGIRPSLYEALVASGDFALVLATGRGPVLLESHEIPFEPYLGPAVIDEVHPSFAVETWREVRGAAGALGRLGERDWMLHSLEGPPCRARAERRMALSWLTGDLHDIVPLGDGDPPTSHAERAWSLGEQHLVVTLALEGECDRPLFAHAVASGELPSAQPVVMGRFSLDHLDGPVAERALSEFRGLEAYREHQQTWGSFRSTMCVHPESCRGHEWPPERWEDFLSPGAFVSPFEWTLGEEVGFGGAKALGTPLLAWAAGGEPCGYSAELWALETLAADGTVTTIATGTSDTPFGLVVLERDAERITVLLSHDRAWIEREEGGYELVSASPRFIGCPC